VTRPCLKRRREAHELPLEAALVEVREVEAVLQSEGDARVFRQLLRPVQVHGRPDFADGVEATLALAVRADDAVRTLIAGAVELAAAVCARDALVEHRPEEAARTHAALAQNLPVVPEPRARAAVVERVQELGRHVDVRPGGEARVALEVLVVVGVDAPEILPRVKHRPLLRIPLGELVVVLAVPAALVAVVPEEYGGVVHVAAHQLAD
jgi:hypothetical protein